jgi:hypothetical protein
MADYADLVTLRENDTVKRRVVVALQAAAHAILANNAATVPALKLARAIADDPFGAETRLFYQVVTGSAILARVTAGTLAATTDTELVTSAAEVLAGLAAAQ